MSTFFYICRSQSSRYRKVGQGSLEIQNIVQSDKGSYTCRATNIEDSVDADAALSVQGNVLLALIRTYFSIWWSSSSLYEDILKNSAIKTSMEVI